MMLGRFSLRALHGGVPAGGVLGGGVLGGSAQAAGPQPSAGLQWLRPWAAR